VNPLSNIATRREWLTRWGAVIGLAGVVGCGSSGGTPIGDLICRGEGVIISGKVTFVKRLYSAQGLTGQQIVKPVRYGLVEIIRDADGRSLVSTYTDRNGSYCIDVPVLSDFPTVYPRVASLTDPGKFKIVVTSEDVNLYSRPGGSVNASQPGIYKRDVPLPLFAQLSGGVEFPFSGAFNVMDVLTTGAEQAIALTGQAPSETLFGVWRPGTVFGAGTFGTFFGADEFTNDAFIVLNGGDSGGPDVGDHDEYDDDVILHEFGHFMAHSFSKDVSPGGAHYLNDNTQDIRLAWSEGWATFFSAAVRGSPVMVNTYAGDPGSPNRDFSYAFDIEVPHADLLTRIGTPLEDYGTYTTNEVAVAAVLWDLFDGVDSRREPGDVSADGLLRVWDVMTRMRTLPPPTVTLEVFASYFGDLFGLTSFAETAKQRLIEFVPDSSEDQDDAIATAPLAGVSASCHTLYPARDIDYLAFTVSAPRSVTVETFNLTNGADTFVQIVDANDGVLVGTGGLKVENDDAVNPKPYQSGLCNRVVPVPAPYLEGPNNGTRFASSVTFDALPGTYTYYAKITSARKNPTSAGELGSYGLVVTLN
jgi:hypothetical protein